MIAIIAEKPSVAREVANIVGAKTKEDGHISGNGYLVHAAKARSESDWLVGINASQSLSIAAGRGTYSLGRVQTPTLAMIC